VDPSYKDQDTPTAEGDEEETPEDTVENNNDKENNGKV
jgi:hypothetical protein